ncbi:MAG: hypothetical protein LCH89_00260 [Proteobacteria bacterium]|nr:hypothetical protein [Pseudomonadota bacterium]
MNKPSLFEAEARARFFRTIREIELPRLLGDAGIDYRYTPWGYEFQIVVVGPCNVSGELETHRGRWWAWDFEDSVHALLRSVFLAVKVFAEHELAEQFQFSGKALFFPSHG